MGDERCDLTELVRNSCQHCQKRPGAVDLHPMPGRTAGGKGYGDEVIRTEWIDGESFGLLSSGGTAYVFGSGHGLHHRRDCVEGSATPAARVLELDDPKGDLWLAVADPARPGAPQRRVVNVNGRPVTVVCGLCGLRPHRT